MSGLLGGGLLLGAGAPSRAAEETAPLLGLHPELTYATKYMAHGMNIGGNHPVWQPALTVDALAPGLQFKAWYNFPLERNERKAYDEADYLILYSRSLREGQSTQIDLHGYFDYWLYPHSEHFPGATIPATGQNKEDLKGFKFNAGLSLPHLIALGDTHLVPFYNYYYWTPEQKDAFQAGGVNELGLSYALPVYQKQTLDLTATLNYYDTAFGFERGWSHATAGAATTFLVRTVKITPSVNYQWSFEDSVNPEDEFWATLTVARDF